MQRYNEDVDYNISGIQSRMRWGLESLAIVRI